MTKPKNVNLFNHTIPYFIELALEQCLKEQGRILELAKKSKHSNKYNLLIKELSNFSIDLMSWYRGKLAKQKPIFFFQKKAKKIEKKANELSAEFWEPNNLNISSVFDYALQEKTRAEGNFEIMIRTHFDIQRSRLLEQIRGARLLCQNSDLGDEVEKVFLEYLQKNLDKDCLVVRGGHIFDNNGNHSDQMDIMVVQASSLSLCPADTKDGKYNVLIDQLIAAISIKSTLHKKSFEEAWKGLQSIPEYADKENDCPRGLHSNWPLCFIVSANSDDVAVLNRTWGILTETQSQQLEMFISLEKGYSIAGSSSWPLVSEPENKGSFTDGEYLQAGLGLGFMLNCISTRSAHLANKPLNIYKKQQELLKNAALQTGNGCPIHSLSSSRFFGTINEVIEWSHYANGMALGNYLTNKIYVHSLHVQGKRLVNNQKPLKQNSKNDGILFESRWFEFKRIFILKNQKTIRLTEWVKNHSDNGYSSQEVEFDLTTGNEIS